MREIKLFLGGGLFLLGLVGSMGILLNIIPGSYIVAGILGFAAFVGGSIYITLNPAEKEPAQQGDGNDVVVYHSPRKSRAGLKGPATKREITQAEQRKKRER